MRPPHLRLLSAVLLLSLTACAGGPSSGAPPRDQNAISFTEIEATHAETAYQVVQQLRPRWMVRNRGQRSIEEGPSDFPRVIVDDLPPREFDVLRQLPKDALQELRFLDAREATFLYGTGYNAGVIKVTTRH
ncbi:hypothetical protein ACFL3S_01650 [Gemmatimonadota bacterium]